MTDRSQPATFSLAALVICRTADASRVAETLLSLAAQTSPDFEVYVVVVDGLPSELGEVSDLVGTFDEGFSSRVEVIAMDQNGSVTPFAFGVERSRATYVAVLYPNDVVFAHWAETFVRNAPGVGGRVMSSLVAQQEVECAAWGNERIVTTVARPRSPDPSGFDLMEHLASPPVLLRGLALPRLAVQGVLAQGIPPGAEGWAVRLAVILSCGIFETGEVTYLSRSSPPAGRSSIDRGGWERDRRAALEILDRCGLALGPGILQSLRPSPAQSSVHQLEEELDLLRERLRRADEVVLAHAVAEAAALQRVADLLSSASWKVSAPMRALGGVARRLRRRPDPTPGP